MPWPCHTPAIIKGGNSAYKKGPLWLAFLFFLSVECMCRCNQREIGWKSIYGKQTKLRPPLLLTVGLQVSYPRSWLLSSLVFALTPTCLLWENKVTPLKTLGTFLFLGGRGALCNCEGNNVHVHLIFFLLMWPDKKIHFLLHLSGSIWQQKIDYALVQWAINTGTYLGWMWIQLEYIWSSRR